MRTTTGTVGLMLVTLCGVSGWASPAHAELTYNYDQHWLLDSSTDLYWQSLPISSATFVPEHGSLATIDTILKLFGQAGSDGRDTPAPYSFPIANLLSFFEYGLPAAASVPDAIPGEFYLQIRGLYNSGYPANSPNHYETAFAYYGLSATTTDWVLTLTSTVGTYGPTNPCFNGATGDACPATQLGFVVSSVNPSTVPIPGGLWLLTSGLVGGFGLLRQRQQLM